MTKKRKYIALLKQLNEERDQYFVDARDENARKNMRLLKKISVFLLLFAALFYVITPFIVTHWSITPIYLAFFPILAIFAIYSVLYARRPRVNPRVVNVSVIAFLIMVIVFAGIIDVYPYPNSPASFMPLLLTTLPVLFVLRYRIIVPLMVLTVIGYDLSAYLVKERSMAQNDIFNSIIGLIFGFVVAFTVVQLRIQDNNAKREYKRRCMIDPVTGILNKSTCEECIRESMQKRDMTQKCALILIDIDNLKRLNDLQGHLVGDIFLEDVADALTQMFRSIDVVGRAGGDEFMIYVRTLEDEEHMAMKCRQIQDEIKSLSNEHGNIQMSCSIGVAISAKERTNFEMMYQKADASLYEAKTLGRGKYVVHHIHDDAALTEQRF